MRGHSRERIIYYTRIAAATATYDNNYIIVTLLCDTSFKRMYKAWKKYYAGQLAVWQR